MMIFVSRKSKVLAILLFFVCAAVLASGISIEKFGLLAQSPQAIQPRVTNRTASVHISNVRQLATGDVEVTFFNQSIKTIYAYTMVTGQRGIRKGITTFATALPVAPGETKVETIPARNLDSAGEIVFSAVYLEGGAVEGDPPDTEKLKGTMQGMKEQAKLALQLLRNVIASREQDAQRLLQITESAIASMSVTDQSAPASREREKGAAVIKDRLLTALEKLRSSEAQADGSLDVKSYIAELIPYYQRLAENL